jgi:hypothetical protein
MTKEELLKKLSFGSSIAEHEQMVLKKYFVQTHLWTEVKKGRVDIILGDKGSGKSAIFLLLQEDQADISVSTNTYLVAAENPRGDAAFKNLAEEPPADEKEIELVWRMYFLVLTAKFLKIRRSESKEFFELNRLLVNAGLLNSSSSSLSDVLWSVRRFISRIKKVGFAVSIDPNTYNPSINPELVLETELERYNEAANKLNELYLKAEVALAAKSLTIWILVDRLDIAFESSLDLERNALRALLRTYSGMYAYPHIKLKIFLRSDLFQQITVGGFREASHLKPKSTELSWDHDGILDVIARRALSNKAITDYYQLDPEAVKRSFREKQELFFRMFPRTIGDTSTLDWILQNLMDGRGKYCPRDVIEFLNDLIRMQIAALERGVSEPVGDMLFGEALFEEALNSVSKQKCETVLYAEYPKERLFIDALRNTNYEHTISSLAHLWGSTEEEALATALRLMRIGLFKQKHNLKVGNFEVSFLYRPALDLAPGLHQQ